MTFSGDDTKPPRAPRIFRWMLCAGASFCAVGMAGSATAQVICGFGSNCQTIVTVSASEELIFNTPTLVTNQTTSFQTELIGKITGGTPLYDQTFTLPFSDPVVQTGVTQARLAITTAGGPGVLIIGPIQTSHTVTTTSSSATIYSFNHADVVTGVETSVGPGSILTGTRSTCAASLATLPSTTRPTCSTGGTLGSLAGGQVDVNVNFDTTDYIDQSTTTTTDTLTSEVYTLTGTVKPIGTVHAVAAVAGFDQAEQFVGRLFAVPDSSGIWIDGWGHRATTPGRGDIPGDTRSGGGINGGFQLRAGDKLRVGASVNWGHTGIVLPDVGESGDIDLTIGALNADFHAGPFFLDAAAGLGFGHVATSVSLPGFGETATGRNRLNVAFGGARVGWRTKIGFVALTPHGGFTVTDVQMGGFTESGSRLALKAPPADSHRTQLYAGLDASVSSSPSFEIGGFARVDARLGDLAPALPATFVSLGAGAPMLTIQGPRDARTGADLGAHASLRLTDHIRAFAAYEAIIGSHASSQSVNIGLTIAAF